MPGLRWWPRGAPSPPWQWQVSSPAAAGGRLIQLLQIITSFKKKSPGLQGARRWQRGHERARGAEPEPFPRAQTTVSAPLLPNTGIWGAELAAQGPRHGRHETLGDPRTGQRQTAGLSPPVLGQHGAPAAV